jgi:hypothetical protein
MWQRPSSGADFSDIRRYREFEISPQGEWIDLAIDLHNPHNEEGWKWIRVSRFQRESIRRLTSGMEQ